jgi:hypothetical protein
LENPGGNFKCGNGNKTEKFIAVAACGLLCGTMIEKLFPKR